MNEWIKQAREAFAQDFTEATLKAMIIGVAVLFIVLALSIDNKWILAGLLAYIVLP